MLNIVILVLNKHISINLNFKFYEPKLNMYFPKALRKLCSTKYKYLHTVSVQKSC